MSLHYVDLGKLLTTLQYQQSDIERYVGLKGYVDWVALEHQITEQPALINQRQTQVLLTAQQQSTNQSALNGLYYIDEHGFWNRQKGIIEVGNIIAVKNSASGTQQNTTTQYYELIQDISDDDHSQQIWQELLLGDLI